MITFTSDGVEYGVADFYERYNRSLPKIVKVSQGFYGDIVEDTFDRSQVIRLHTISRQKRVAAKTELRGKVKYFSIPLNYQNMKLCVIDKKGNVGKEKDLVDIVKKEKALPVHVQFPRDKTITFVNVQMGTNNLPSLELTHVFEEIYFLGNFVNEGEMTLDVSKVPLYLTQLRLVLITGIADQPVSAWKQFQASLSEQARALEYNKDFGNPEMAEYSTSSFVETSTDLYSYMEPSQYYNFLPLAARNTSTSSRESQEIKAKDTKPSVSVQTKGTDDKITKVQTTNQNRANVYENTVVYEHTVKAMPTGNNSAQQLTESGENLYEFIDDIGARTDQARSNKGNGTDCPRFPPPLPPRSGLEKPRLEQNKTATESRHYENNVPRGRVLPIIKDNAKEEQTASPIVTSIQDELKAKFNTTLKKETPSKSVPVASKPVPAQKPAKPVQKSTPVDSIKGTGHVKEHHQQNTLENETAEGQVCKPKMKETKHLPPVNVPDDIIKLTIDDVCEYLRVLRLEAYIEEFRNQQVDGELLHEVDRDMLKNEFGMKAIEATRLLKFVSKAHVPK